MAAGDATERIFGSANNWTQEGLSGRSVVPLSATAMVNLQQRKFHVSIPWAY